MDQRANFLALILLDALEDENPIDVYNILKRNDVDASFVPHERGIAPIHYSCGMENQKLAIEITKKFLESGADPNVRSAENMTPLHVAAMYGREEIVKLLLQYDAKVYILDDERKTPVHYAIEECHFEVVQCMRDHVFKKKLEQKTKLKNGSIKVQQCTNLQVPVATTNNHNFENSENSLANTTQPNEKKNLLKSTMDGTNSGRNTPNKIYYNFDETSPYYINITHRRNRPQPKYPNTPTKTNDANQDLADNSNVTNVNLFTLTKEKLEELSQKQKGTPADRSRLSIIEIWREKVQRSRARQSIVKRFDDVEEMVDNVMENDELNFTNTVLNEQSIEDQNGNTSKQDAQCVANSVGSAGDGDGVGVGQQRKSGFSLGTLIQRVARAHLANIEPEPNADIKIEVTDSSYQTVPEILNECNNENEKKSQAQETRESNNLPLPNRFNYFLQMTEAYVHTDDEMGLVFYETKLLSNAGNKQIHLSEKQTEANNENENDDDVNNLKANATITTQSTNVTIPVDYDTDILRKELTFYGEPPGPITKSTKRLYIKRLIKYKRGKTQLLELNKNNKEIDFSVELFRTLRSIENYNRISDYNKYEDISKSYFAQITNPRQFREGHIKQSFIYLLIDPRLSCNLPGESLFLDISEIWQRFLHAIFYVGKGKTSRPYAHLYEAMKKHSQFHSAEQTNVANNNANEKYNCNKISMRKKPVNMELFKSTEDNPVQSKKIKRILEIWKEGKGVVCLHVFHNILPIEAYTREAAMIDALSIQHLTNIKRGNYYGPAQTWTMREKKYFGIVLLRKALQIYLSEGESQLSPSDLI